MIWHPYTQMKTMADPLEVVRAEGSWLTLKNGQKILDGVASWWSVIHGYNHPELNQILTQQVSQMAHVMLGGLTHQPAKDLANRLIEVSPPGMKAVFFSDSGSVGVEVALKMALQFWFNKGVKGKTKFLALRNGYHGDTQGAMSVCDPVDSMHHLFASVLPVHLFLPTPTFVTLTQDIAQLETLFQTRHHEIAAFILEPILQAAGGFQVYPSEYLSAVRALCTHYKVIWIADEVATGFGRTGTCFACNHANVSPDIMVLGKGLTGGYLGHAATLAQSFIFDAFFSDNPEHALMHGPTFMGNPLACSVALKSIEIFFRDDYLKKIEAIEKNLQAAFQGLTHPQVKSVKILGAMAALEVESSAYAQSFQAFALEREVWIRPFGRYVYVMPAYTISLMELDHLTSVILEKLTQP